MIFLDFADYAYRYGIVAGIIILIIRNRWLRKKIDSLLPPWAQSHSEINKEYVNNQARIESKLDHIAERQGIEWPASILSPWTNVSATKKRTPFTLRVQGLFSARSARKYTNSNGGKTMNKLKKPDTITMIVGFIALVLNRLFELDLDPTNIGGSFIMLLSFIKSYELIYVARNAQGLPTTIKWNSRKLIFTIGAILIMAADQWFQLGMTKEMVFTIIATITGYNLYEGKKDAEEAKEAVPVAKHDADDELTI